MKPFTLRNTNMKPLTLRNTNMKPLTLRNTNMKPFSRTKEYFSVYHMQVCIDGWRSTAICTILADGTVAQYKCSHLYTDE